LYVVSKSIEFLTLFAFRLALIVKNANMAVITPVNISGLEKNQSKKELKDVKISE